MLQELRHKHKLADLLAVSNLPRSVFYYHIHQSTKPDKDLDIKEQINHIYHQHKGRYGYRRICAELNNQLSQKGMVINHKKVQRLMQEMGLKAKIRQQRYKAYSSYQGEQPNKIKDNVLQRDFKADKPNQKWATDITEFKVQDKTQTGEVTEKKLYLSPMIDLFNGEIISDTIKDGPTYELVKEMLDDALSKLSQEKMDDKLKSAQIELGQAVLQVLNDKGVVSVADKDSQAVGVIVCHAPNDDVHKGMAFAKVGVQIAGGVPLQVGEPSDYKSFRIGLFGLDKLTDVSGTVARFKQACDDVFHENQN